jgi:hypothetical protein
MIMTTRKKSFTSLTGARLACGMLLAVSLWAAPFSFTTGIPDGRLGALSRRAGPGKIETETADDFFLQQTAVITQAKIIGLVPLGTPLENIKEVEIEVYHIFPLDSADPPSGNVPSRANSPSDVEIDSATRAKSSGTLAFSAAVLDAGFFVGDTVVNGINKLPNVVATNGEGPATGEEVELTITFTSPIVLPQGHYFFRPEVLVSSGDFLYLSAPRPIVPPGIPFTGDLQAWIRNSNLAPDWLRIGTDIVGGATPPTFNMTFSLTGETVPQAGTPGQANCHGQSMSALARQFASVDTAAVNLGFASMQAFQDAFKLFCEP